VGKFSRLAVLVAVFMLASACAVAPYDPYYDVPVGVAPPVSVEYPGYYWTSPRWRPADARRPPIARAAPPAWRAPYGAASRADGSDRRRPVARDDHRGGHRQHGRWR
jgi:hypothetical protein